MEATEVPVSEPAQPVASSRGTATVVEVIGIVSLGVTLMLDLTSRFIRHDPTLFRIANAAALVAAVCAVLDAIATAAAYRRHPHRYRIHLAADITAALLLVLSVALRFSYWDINQGTPIRAIVPVVIAGLLIALATWTNLKGEDPSTDEPAEHGPGPEASVA